MSDPSKARAGVLLRLTNSNAVGDHRYEDEWFAEEVVDWCRDCGIPSPGALCEALEHGYGDEAPCGACINNHPPCPAPDAKLFDPSECNCDECDPDDCEGGCICEEVADDIRGIDPVELIEGYSQSFRDYMDYNERWTTHDEYTKQMICTAAGKWFIEQNNFVTTQGIRQTEERI